MCLHEQLAGLPVVGAGKVLQLRCVRGDVAHSGEADLGQLLTQRRHALRGVSGQLSAEAPHDMEHERLILPQSCERQQLGAEAAGCPDRLQLQAV